MHMNANNNGQTNGAACLHNTVRVEGRYADGGWYGHCANCNIEQFLEFLILPAPRG
jgi:hypothetical protein